MAQIVEMAHETRPLRVVVHTLNPAGREMAERLERAGVPVAWVRFARGTDRGEEGHGHHGRSSF